MTLLQIAFSILAAGACGGVFFTTLLLLKIRYPAWFGIGHGLLGLLGVAVLTGSLLQAPPEMASATRAWWALGAFTAGLLGGVVLFRLLFPKRRPLVLALLHGGFAVAGLVLLYPVAFATP
jgi:hypothetical protein